MLGLAMAGMFSLPTYGQVGLHEFPAPVASAPMFGNAAWAPSAPTLSPSGIDDKAKGVTIYAGQRMDQSKLRSLIKFKSKDAYNFQRIQYYEYPGDQGLQQYGLYCGASNGKDYYGIFSYDYTFSSMGKSLAKINMETGDTTVVRGFTTEEQNSWYGEGIYGNKRNGLYDMAYDPSTDTYFALGYGWTVLGTDDDGNTLLSGHTVLYVVDVETGTWDSVKDFDEILYEFCFDSFGNMYATRPKAGKVSGQTANVGTEIVKYDSNLQEVSASEVKNESGEAVVMVQFGAISIDNNTGTLYWFPATANGATKLYTVSQTERDKKGNYVATDCASLMPSNWLCGLYIPYLAADNAKAAGQVKNLTATPNSTGSISTTLSWTNPSKTWDGSDLSAFKEVRIYRKKAGVATNDRITSKELLSSSVSELVATVAADGKMGEAMQYVDSKAQAGENTYYVVPSRVSGELGVPDSIRCYVGSDYPGAVLNAKVVKNGDGLKVTWDAPTDGLNNGYFNPAELKYTLTRMPDNKVVAKDITATSFEDNDLGNYSKYYYNIQASTNAGGGAIVKTDGVMAGTAYTAPASFTFQSEDDAARWTNYMYGSPFEYSDYHKCLVAYGNTSEYSATLLSPPLKLEAGKTYRLAADFYENEMDCSYDLKTTMGKNSADTEGATVLTDEMAIECGGYERSLIEDKFTAPEDGVYYYGLSVATHQEYNSFRLYGFTLERVYDNDLQAVEMTDVKDAVAGKSNTCTVKVRNVGAKDQSNYKVRVYCNDEGKKTIIGETTDVPTIKADATKNIEVKFTPTMDGLFSFYAEVVLEGDENASNNLTPEIPLKVLEETTAVWNKTVTSKKDEGYDTHGPVVYYSTYDHTEAIYYASEIKGEEGDIIKRIGYPYNGNDNLTDRTDESAVKVYIGQTDKKSFASAADGMDASELTLVYDGKMTLDPGEDNMLIFDLDTPFEYDPAKNLVVVVDREGGVPSSQMFCALFKVFSNNWSSGAYRSLSFSESYEYSSGKGRRFPGAPMLYLAVENPTGIASTKVLGGLFNYDSNSGLLTLDEAVNSVAVYSVDGKLVKRANVRGGQQTLSLAKGVYVLRMTTADGKVNTAKLNVAK